MSDYLFNGINLLTAEELCNRVRDDLVARGVCNAQDVVYGDWEPPRKDRVKPTVRPRIVFGLGTGNFSIQEAGPQEFPGGAYNYTLGGPEIYNARSVWTVQDFVTITIDAATEIQRSDNAALTAQRATIILRNQVLAALYRVAHGSIIPGSGQWIDPQNAEFKYGSRLQFQVAIQIPILDDPSILLGSPYTKIGEMYLSETLDGYITLDGYN